MGFVRESGWRSRNILLRIFTMEIPPRCLPKPLYCPASITLQGPQQGGLRLQAIEQAISNPHIIIMNKGTIVMRKLVAVFAGLGLIIAAFAGLALAFVIGIAAAGAMLVARLTGRLGPSAPAWRAATQRAAPGGHKSHTRDYRVWNDGRGTIIDM